VPLSRGDDTFQQIDVRIAAVAFVALVAAIVQGWSWLVPAAIALVGGGYAIELALDDAPLDVAAPVVAAGLLLAAELAYWSLDERSHTIGDPGEGLRRAALVATGAAGALVVASALLALVDEVRGRGLALNLVGAVAASWCGIREESPKQKLADFIAGAVVVGQHRAGKADHGLSISSWFGPARGSHEQVQVEHSLDLGQGLGHRRLTHRQEFRSAPQVPELVERNDQLQVPQFQVGSQHPVDIGHV